MKNKTLGTWLILAVAAMLSILGFASFKFHKSNVEGNILINIDSSYGNLFVTETTVRDIIFGYRTENNKASFEKINLRDVEYKLQEIDFVNDAQVSRNIKGDVVVEVEQQTPLARVIPNTGKGGYITTENTIIDLSANHTSRVLVITGVGADSLMNWGYLNSEKGAKFSEFIRYINSNPFWKKQISQIDLNAKMEIMVYPQIGKQKIELGSVENFQEKLKKVQIFYNKIVPKRGWGKYEFVSVKYENQIVCR